MNRLWVRLALAFSAVVLIVAILSMLISVVVFPLDEFFALAREMRQNDALRESFMQRRGVNFVLQMLLVALAGISAGIWFSRSLTAPLNRLAEAARAIGRRELDQRVPMEGSREIREVSQAFNHMAADLSRADEARRNLMVDIAHELRTPLSVLNGNLQALLDGVYEMNDEEVRRLQNQTLHLNRLVDDLHQLSLAEARRLPLNIEPVETVAVVKDAAAPFEPLARARQVSLRVELLGKVEPVEVDAARLRQAIQNIVGNALQHTPAGGTITLRAETTPEALVITIMDTGRGISAEHLPHIFDRFYRADRARTRSTQAAAGVDLPGSGGSGLGLAISAAIAEAHGGTVRADSPGVEQGSTFTIRLPR